jgi:hypothetical protein
MKSAKSTNQENSEINASIVEELISSYEIAVLSTLFEEDDSNKIGDLAKQWGYQQEFLQSIWKEIHGDVIGEPPTESGI